MERSIPPGRGIVGMAHSRRMGVISSALPGLSQWEGPSHIENKTEEEREWWTEKEILILEQQGDEVFKNFAN